MTLKQKIIEIIKNIEIYVSFEEYEGGEAFIKDGQEDKAANQILQALSEALPKEKKETLKMGEEIKTETPQDLQKITNFGYNQALKEITEIINKSNK